MDREALEKLAAGNRVDLAEVLRVEAELLKLERAGVYRREGYSITPPLGRPPAALERQPLASLQADDDPGEGLCLAGR